MQLTDSSSLHLALPPPPSVRLLRCERGNVSAEVALLAWLSSVRPAHDETKGASFSASHPNYLEGFIPRVIQDGFPEFLLSDPCHGTTVAEVQTPFTHGEEKFVGYQAGRLFRRISCHVSPTGMFGYAEDVLRCNWQTQAQEPTSPSDRGFSTWSQAFHLLLESALRDLEDSCVQIEYGQVRAHFERLGHLLDRVERPSLVVLEAGESTNLVVSVPTECKNPRDHDGIRITGLRDWSSCLFGDPLVAVIFANEPSQDFLDGLGASIGDLDPFKNVPIIQDEVHASARLALYQSYHSLCGIARQYRRPRDPEVDMELYWRKRLQSSLANLSSLDDNRNEGQSLVKGTCLFQRGAR